MGRPSHAKARERAVGRDLSAGRAGPSSVLCAVALLDQVHELGLDRQGPRRGPAPDRSEIPDAHDGERMRE